MPKILSATTPESAMKYVIVEERVVVTEHPVSELTADDRITAFDMFDVFCAKHRPHRNTKRMIMYEVDAEGNRQNVASE